MSNEVKRVVLYARASKDEKGQAASVTSQIATGRQWANSSGIEIVAEFVDNASSASRSGRAKQKSPQPQREQMLTLIRRASATDNPIQAIWMTEISRLSRDTTDASRIFDELDDLKVAIGLRGSFLQPSDAGQRGQIMFLSAMATTEAGFIRERITRTVSRGLAEGKPHGPVPYGYRREYDPQSGALLRQVPDQKTAAVLRRFTAQLLDERLALNEVARRANTDEIPNPRKHRKTTPQEEADTSWNDRQIRQLLLNPTIAGWRAHKREPVVEGQWEAIIPFERWEELRTLLTDPARMPKNQTTEPHYLLSGIARCGQCGAGLRRRQGRTKNRTNEQYACFKPGCYGVSIVMEQTDNLVIDRVAAWLGQPGVKEGVEAATKGLELREDETVALAREKVQELVKRRDAMLKNLSDETQDWPAVYWETLTNLNERIKEVEQEFQDALPVHLASTGRDLLNQADPAQAWRDADFTVKRDLLTTMWRINVVSTGRTGRNFDPSRVKMLLKT